MTRTIDQIRDDASSTIQRLLDDAFQAGRVVGRAEGADDLRQRLSGLLMASETPTKPVTKKATEKPAPGARRAAPGSVKPTILELIKNEPGITQDEIGERTGIKHNSIRGTLWALMTLDKAIHKIDGCWYPVVGKDEPAATSATGSDVNLFE
jgi:hypothetical protein